MRLRVASDRAFRSIAKTLSSSPRPSHSRSRRHGNDRLPRDLGTFAVPPSQPIRTRDIVVLLLAFAFFLQSLFIYLRGRTFFRPQSAWRWTGSSSGSVALVSACSDASALKKMLESIDGTSMQISVAFPVNVTKIESERHLTVSQVEGGWMPGSALNLAAARANTEWLLLLPCGCGSPKKLPEKIRKGFFYSKRLIAEEDLCQRMILLHKNYFFNVGGADERISGVWDPSLHSRLRAAGLRHREMKVEASRCAYERDAYVQLLFDALLQGGAPPWGRQLPEQQRPDDAFEAAQYDRRRRRANRALVAAEYELPNSGLFRPVRSAIPLSALLVEGGGAKARAIALRDALRLRYGLPRAVSMGMSTQTLARLYETLASAQWRTRSEQLRFVVAHVQHGLGNRLRAMGSALAYAAETGRVPIVVWERDAHCEARFSALFEENNRIFVSQLGPRWPLAMEARLDGSWGFWTSFNYMESEGAGATKDAAVEAARDRHVYFKSAFAMRAAGLSSVTWTRANEEIRALRPAPAVAAMAVDANRRPTMGVHVRALPVQGEIVGAKYAENATKLLTYWRAKSAPSVFAAEMRRIRAAEPGMTFLVAADSEAARAELRQVPGAVVLDGCDGRGATCMQKAFAEMLALADCGRFLGSPWSSFSEAVVRLGGAKMRVAGIDFAADRWEDVLRDHGEEVARVVKEVQRRRAENLKKGH